MLMYRQVDLCAGTGGFSMALKDYCKVVYANDYEPNSKLIYDLNFNDKLTLGDLMKIPVELKMLYFS
jgi:site-specific DNA-cytosine methylase